MFSQRPASRFRREQNLKDAMRLAIVSLEKSGGILHCAFELAKTMARSADVTCYLVQNDMLAEFETLPCPIRVFPLTRGLASNLVSMVTGRQTSAIARAILLNRSDLVLDAGCGAWERNLLRHIAGRIPIAQVVHDVDPHPDARARIASIPNRIGSPLANVFVALSSFSYERLRQRYPGRVCLQARHGIIVLRDDVSVDVIAAQRHQALFLGRIEPYKGVDTLVEAFVLAKQLDPRLSLDIVGRGRIKPGVVRQIHRLGIGLDNRYVSNAEMARVVSSHGMMVLPYHSATQSGIAAIALANGLPCVATNVGGLPEHVIHGRNGLVVPPRDPVALAEAMAAISGDPAVARHMAEEALRIGRTEYSWNAIGQRLLDDLAGFLTSNGNAIAIQRSE